MFIFIVIFIISINEVILIVILLLGGSARIFFANKSAFKIRVALNVQRCKNGFLIFTPLSQSVKIKIETK